MIILRYILLIFFTFSLGVKANSIEGGDWIVTDFVGEDIFVKTDKIIGQKQKFYDGIDGVFLNCKGGSVWGYTKYDTLEELISNKEFKLLQEHKESLNLIETIYYVHRLSCSGEREGETMMSLYPFITNGDPNSQKAYYIFEMGIFELEIKEPRN